MFRLQGALFVEVTLLHLAIPLFGTQSSGVLGRRSQMSLLVLQNC